MASTALLATGRANAAPHDKRQGGGKSVETFDIHTDSHGKEMIALGRSRMAAGDCLGALDAFDEALRSTVDASARRDRGICHEKLGHPYPAIEDYRAYLTASPDAADAPEIRDRLQKLQSESESASNDQDEANGGLADIVRETTASGGAAQLAMPERSEFRPPSARTAFNSIFVEGLGNGLFYSLNYDRMFGEHWSFRLGAGFARVNGFTITNDGNALSVEGARVNFLSVPVLINYLIGRSNHKLEIGLGATLLVVGGQGKFSGFETSENGVKVFGTGVIGYRYAPREGGFNFRVGFTPLIESSKFHAWGGLSLGYGF